MSPLFPQDLRLLFPAGSLLATIFASDQLRFPEMENHEVLNQAGWPMDPQRNKGPRREATVTQLFPYKARECWVFSFVLLLFC